MTSDVKITVLKEEHIVHAKGNSENESAYITICCFIEFTDIMFPTRIVACIG